MGHFPMGIIQCGAPKRYVCWFRFAPVTIVISTINHSYWSYWHQLSYLGGPTLYIVSHVRMIPRNHIVSIDHGSYHHVYHL